MRLNATKCALQRISGGYWVVESDYPAATQPDSEECNLHPPYLNIEFTSRTLFSITREL